jgi:hypothetical protein
VFSSGKVKGSCSPQEGSSGRGGYVLLRGGVYVLLRGEVMSSSRGEVLQEGKSLLKREVSYFPLRG